MTAHPVERLKEYGLSQNEAIIYIALLKTGEASAQKIAKNAKLPRTTSYHLLDSLSQRGLVSYVIKGKVKYFQAASPKRLTEILEEKKRMIQEFIPELMGIAETIKEKPRVVVFEGLNGIKTILQDVLQEKREILHYGDIISLQNALPFIFPQFIKRRVEKKIPIRIICKREDAHKELLRTAKKEYRQFIFIPKNYIFKSSIFIYSDKVAILSLQSEPYYGIIIEDKDYYETQRNIFGMLKDAYARY